MDRKQPVSGEFYRHFKGKLFQIKMLARDSESQAWRVVYQQMYPPFQCLVQGLQEFMEPVDREKYPDSRQQYRFEKAEPTHLAEEKLIDTEKNEERGKEHTVEEAISSELFRKAIISGQPERYLKDVMTEQEIAERGFLELLDAETFREKRQIFLGLRNYMTPLLISNIAVALDIVLDEGNAQEQYESVLRCLEAHEHYEGGRLR